MTHIIIINYNGYNDTIECLNSIKDSNTKDYEIVLIDNNSTDNSVQVLQEWVDSSHQNIKFIKSLKNGGFSYGNNLGINYALSQNSDNIILLNNDTIIDKDAINNLVNSPLNDNLTILGGVSYYHDKPDTIWFDGGIIDTYKAKSYHLNRGKKSPSKIDNISFITFCYVLIPPKVIQKVGLMNEEYFMYVEDMEYCYRATQNGIKLNIVPNSKIWHKVGASSGAEVSEFSAYWITKNKVKFIFENLPLFQKISAFTYLIVSRVRLFQWILQGKFNLVNAQFRGLRDGIKGQLL